MVEDPNDNHFSLCDAKLCMGHTIIDAAYDATLSIFSSPFAAKHCPLVGNAMLLCVYHDVVWLALAHLVTIQSLVSGVGLNFV